MSKDRERLQDVSRAALVLVYSLVIAVAVVFAAAVLERLDRASYDDVFLIASCKGEVSKRRAAGELANDLRACRAVDSETFPSRQVCNAALGSLLRSQSETPEGPSFDMVLICARAHGGEPLSTRWRRAFPEGVVQGVVAHLRWMLGAARAGSASGA